MEWHDEEDAAALVVVARLQHLHELEVPLRVRAHSPPGLEGDRMWGERVLSVYRDAPRMMPYYGVDPVLTRLVERMMSARDSARDSVPPRTSSCVSCVCFSRVGA